MKRYLSWWLGMLIAALACHAAAQDYPARPVRMIVGFAPGGGNDILARLMAEQLQRRLGQPFIVENRPGASGAIAIGAVKRAPADGYTLLVGPSSGMTVNPALYRELDYDPVADFAPISLVGDIPMILVVKKDSPARSVGDLAALAGKNGKPLFAGAGANSFQLATAVFSSRTAIPAEVVNYKGNSAVVAALLSNEIDFALVDAAAVLPQLRSGHLRALAVTGARRFTLLPDVPTVTESGVQGFAMSFWSSLYAPAGTPDAVVATLQSAISAALREPDVARRLLELGIEPVGSSSQALAETMAREIPLYKQAAKAANLSLSP
ncbi:tripartite tricarboxylate transporter substrate binding protein [Achromobacter sp. Marseille-Q4962]|uniref:Bug family tripartite tricarboxylate transporter substrate binding protein n=1 Tax=Achromobacter sp. Marseille-Q4962 TaxID=2942202 RepID=UPI002073E170|nr:tripartite tricarboxylate transporter substrate binding protein [Achromobacter sp. Marseille-Q4962]